MFFVFCTIGCVDILLPLTERSAGFLMHFYDSEDLRGEKNEPKRGHETTFMNRSEAGKKSGSSPMCPLSIGENADFNGVKLMILWPC